MLPKKALSIILLNGLFAVSVVTSGCTPFDKSASTTTSTYRENALYQVQTIIESAQHHPVGTVSHGEILSIEQECWEFLQYRMVHNPISYTLTLTDYTVLDSKIPDDARGRPEIHVRVQFPNNSGVTIVYYADHIDGCQELQR